MSECKLDHSLQDVKKKLGDQSNFLPANLLQGLDQLLNNDLGQYTLNEVFHLLKKYDLASTEEQRERNQKIEQLLTN